MDHINALDCSKTFYHFSAQLHIATFPTDQTSDSLLRYNNGEEKKIRFKNLCTPVHNMTFFHQQFKLSLTSTPWPLINNSL